MEIKTTNKITEACASAPKYIFPQQNRTIRFFYAGNDEVIILGQADRDQYFWISKTNLFDENGNDDIMDYIVECPIELVTDIETAASQIGSSYQQMLYMYHDKVYQDKKTPNRWMGPFQKTFGRGLIELYQQGKALAENEDPQTQRKLQDYLLKMFDRNDSPEKVLVRFYPIIKEVRKLQYLFLSDDESVRMMYTEVKKSCNEIIVASLKKHI